MDTTLSVLLSSPKPEHLAGPQQRFVDAFKDHVTQNGLRLVYPDSPASDRLDVRLQQFKTCHGVVILALSQWEGRRLNRNRGAPVVFPSEFSHIATVMAVAAGKPLLVLREESVAKRGALREGYIPASVKLPRSLNITWLGGTEFRSEFTKWLDQVKCFRHVFLGYSSQDRDVADRVSEFLITKLQLRVLDWNKVLARDEFALGDTIRDSIIRAEQRTSCGLFLFMADDRIGTGDDKLFAGMAPRDNVVYEAGYFAGAKGPRRSIVIREKGAKVPTDLEGVLYLTLTSRNDTTSIETKLRAHLESIVDGLVENEAAR